MEVTEEAFEGNPAAPFCRRVCDLPCFVVCRSVSLLERNISTAPCWGRSSSSWTVAFPFLCLWAPALSLPACAAVLTARRSLSTSHLVADSLFQPVSYSFKSLFESRNGSHFGFSKTNMDKTTQCPLSMMDTGDPLKFPVAKVWLITGAIFLPRYLCGGFTSNYGS